MRILFMTAIVGAVTLAGCQAPANSTRSNASAASPAASGSAMEYPAAKSGKQVDSYHGTQVADPYRSLEDTESADTRAWITAENKLTFGYLETIPGRDKIKRRLTEIWNYERYTSPLHYGNHYFFTRNDGLQNQAVLFVADSLDANPTVLLDPNALSSDGTVALKDFVISEDGRHVAYGLSAAGSDWEDWHVLDVDSAKPTNDVLKWVKFSTVSWRRDGTGFFYSRYDEPKDGNALKNVSKFQKLYFHRLGEKQADDLLIYERKDQPDWMFAGQVTDDGHYLMIAVTRSTEHKNLVLYRDLAKKEKEATTETLIGDWDASYEYLGNTKGTLYFVTDNDAPRNRIVAIDLDHPKKASWKELVPQAADTLQNARAVNHSFVANYMKDAHSEVRVFNFKGKPVGSVALPGLGTANGFTGRTRDKDMFYTYSSFTTPPVVFHYDLAQSKSSVFREPKLSFDPAQFETRQVFYTSKDGTRVPMFITARKGVSLSGDNPTILYGYGGFNIPLQPAFSPAVLGWLDMGGVYAVANLRGGGEYGREWHEAGIKTHKQNVFDDCIAAAEYLIHEKYTSARKLALRGASNGGLLVAATELQRPDLFAAAIPQVGVLDMLRFRDFTIGKAWQSDYGSVDDAEEFKALLAYSPLQNLKKGVDYPPTLIITGDHDDRVFPAHSFKFAATLQADNPRGRPALIRIETRAGHGQGKPTTMQIEETVDVYAFILKAFGLAS